MLPTSPVSDLVSSTALLSASNLTEARRLLLSILSATRGGLSARAIGGGIRVPDNEIQIARRSLGFDNENLRTATPAEDETTAAAIVAKAIMIRSEEHTSE